MPSCPVGHESAADDYCDQCGRKMGGAPESASGAGGPAGSGLTAGAPSGAQANGAHTNGAHADGAQAGSARANGGQTGTGQASSAQASRAQASSAQASSAQASGEPATEPCPECGTPRSGRFCEVCRFDVVSGTPTAAHPGPERQATPAGGETGPPPAASSQDPATASDETGATPLAAPGSDGTAWLAVVTADRGYFDRVVAVGGPEAAAISFPPYCPERRFALGTPRAGEEKQIGRHSSSRGIDPAIDLTGPPTDPGISRLHAVLIGQADGSWAVLDPGSENGTFVNDAEITVGVQVPLQDGDRIHLGAWTAITIRRSNKPQPQ
jgi:FHA domain